MAETGMDTLAAVVADLDRRGYSEHFAVDGNCLRALGSGHRFAPRDVIIRDYVRFEGISDPDDMSIVYAMESRSGTRGVLVDAFGVYADPAISAFLEEVEIHRGRLVRAAERSQP